MTLLTAAGLASSMGNSVSAMAAARAGINRRGPLGIELPEPGQAEPAVVAGHRCRSAGGAEDYGRLGTLLLAAGHDAFRDVDPGIMADARSWFVLALPVRSERPALYDIEDEDREIPGGPIRFLLDRIRIQGGIPLQDERCQIREMGHAGVFSALTEIIGWMQGGEVDRVLLAAVDSLVDAANLEWLAGSGRLKIGSNQGLFPGEGASMILLETEQAAKRRGARPLGRVSGAYFVQGTVGDPAQGEDGPLPLGYALSQALTLCLHGKGIEAIGALSHDGNGEIRRARHLWANLMNLDSAYGALLRLPQWLIAESFGDLGAATGAFQICSAIRAFERRYAPGEEFLLCATSDDGSSGAVTVARP